MSDFDAEFEGIAAANPDLNGGESVVNFRHGGVLAEISEAEANALARTVSAALWYGGDYRSAIGAEVSPLVAWAVADVAFQNVTSQLFLISAADAGKILERCKEYMVWAAGFRARMDEEATDGR